jgi:hypothetical protein
MKASELISLKRQIYSVGLTEAQRDEIEKIFDEAISKVRPEYSPIIKEHLPLIPAPYQEPIPWRLPEVWCGHQINK